MKLKPYTIKKKQYYGDSIEDQMLFNRVMIFIFAPLIKNLSWLQKIKKEIERKGRPEDTLLLGLLQ